MQRGEVWWAKYSSMQAPRPVVLLSPPGMAKRRRRVTVVPVTSTVRDLPTEVGLDQRDGLRRPCVAATQDVVTVDQGVLLQPIATLSDERVVQIERALHLSLGIQLPCRTT
jgi:mRNA interferase MazF